MMFGWGDSLCNARISRILATCTYRTVISLIPDSWPSEDLLYRFRDRRICNNRHTRDCVMKGSQPALCFWSCLSYTLWPQICSSPCIALSEPLRRCLRPSWRAYDTLHARKGQNYESRKVRNTARRYGFADLVYKERFSVPHTRLEASISATLYL